VSENVTGHVPQSAVDSDHRRHDQLLVTRFAAGDADESEAQAARALVEQCSRCGALVDDLRLVASSLQRLPPPRRPRDFRLTQAQADHLRGGIVQRLLRALAGPRLAVLRPLAGAAMTIGIALAVVGTALPAYAPGTASAPAFDQGTPREAVAPLGSMAPVAATAAPMPSSVIVPPPSPAEVSPMGSTVAPSIPGTDAQQPENYNNTSSAPPPPAGDSSGGQSEIGQATQAPQPAKSATGYVAPATPGTEVNPVPAAEQPAQPGSGSSAAGQVLVLGGLAVAALGLAVLLLIAYSRRRFQSGAAAPVSRTDRPSR
jgi:hypothetical protein